MNTVLSYLRDCWQDARTFDRVALVLCLLGSVALAFRAIYGGP